jgi:Family of unknown function (DUF6072)
MENDAMVPLNTGVKFASEVLIPGGSNLVKGDFVTGAIHAVLGLAARAMFGLPGLLIVSANSFSKATTGRNLMENMRQVPPAPPQSEPDK